MPGAAAREPQRVLAGDRTFGAFHESRPRTLVPWLADTLLDRPQLARGNRVGLSDVGVILRLEPRRGRGRGDAVAVPNNNR